MRRPAAVPFLRNVTLDGSTFWLYVAAPAVSYDDADLTCNTWYTQLAWFDSPAQFRAVAALLAADVSGVSGREAMRVCNWGGGRVTVPWM